jgi:uncharacterized membrane protein
VASSVKPGRRADLVAITLLTTLGGVMRFATLDARSLWLDEATTILRARLPLGEMLATILALEGTPPTYFILVKGWMEVFGQGEVGLRSLSALLGTATIPIMYAIGRELGGRRAARIAALLTALSPPLVWLSQDGRAYPLLLLAVAVSFLFFVRALREPTGSNLAGWALASGGALVTHYFALYLVVVEGLWLLTRHRSSRPAIGALAGVAATTAALGPMVLAQRGNGAGWITESPLALRVARLPAEFAAGFQPPWEIATAVFTTALLGLSFVLLLRGTAAERRAACIPVLVALGAVALPVALALGGIDRVYPRHLIATWIPVGIAAALGFAVRRHARVATVALAALCCAWVGIHLATFDHPKFGDENWRAAARAVGPAAHKTALVVTPGGSGSPLIVYLGAQRMEPAATTLNEIVAIGLPPRESRPPGQRPQPPRPPSPAPAPGFVETARVEEPDFTLVRYRAPRAIRVTRAELQRLALDDRGSRLLLQPPSGR